LAVLLIALAATDLLAFSGYHLRQADQQFRGLAARADQDAQAAVSFRHAR
jgi:hypothetical protein